jgi:MFS family permease
MTDDDPDIDRIPQKTGIVVFLAFALAYFCSTLVRAVTATLSPALTQEFSLEARDLGLLAGGYFLGFAATQLPLGVWLDRYGPKRVILGFLALAAMSCLAFSAATSFTGLLLSRALLGMGVSACLMAPLTGYRRWFNPGTLLRTNSWMLMTGSFGMLASTLPVQWLLPITGWRPLFWMLAVLIVLAMGLISRVVPPWRKKTASRAAEPLGLVDSRSGTYTQVWRNSYFRKMSPIAAVNYGGVIAIQTLWAGPWMIKVAGYTPLSAAAGLFWINASMLLTFWTWGLVNPWLAKQGWPAARLIAWGVPVSMTVLAVNIAMGSATGWAGWALFCMSSSVLALAQPAVGMALPAALAGRALTGFNLVTFVGVFIMQWGMGLLIDAFQAAGLTDASSFQATMGVYLCCCLASYIYFLRGNSNANPDN